MKEWEEDLYRYRLTPAPPPMPLQEYTDSYLNTGDDTYIAYFLHYYESSINSMATAYVQGYAMNGHFADIKSACVYGIMAALQGYKTEKGPFVPYAQYEIKRAVDDYIRTMRTGYSVPNDTEYYLLRKAMRLFAEHDYKTDEATISAISDAIHREPKTVLDMLRGGLRNMRFIDFYRSYTDEDSEESAEDVTCDLRNEPCAVLIRQERNDAIYEAFQSLTLRERTMLSEHLGFCPDCFSTRDKDGKPLPKWTYMDIMLQFGLSSPDTVDKTCRRALNKLVMSLRDIL